MTDLGHLNLLPPTFKEHIYKARDWMEVTKDQQQLVSSGSGQNFMEFRDTHWPAGKHCQVAITNNDVLCMATFVEPRRYTLFVLDLPRGLQLESRSNSLEYDQRFEEEQFKRMVSQFCVITTAKIFRIVVFHSADDMGMVRNILQTVCKSYV